jgi:hypothetical protein
MIHIKGTAYGITEDALLFDAHRQVADVARPEDDYAVALGIIRPTGNGTLFYADFVATERY